MKKSAQPIQNVPLRSEAARKIREAFSQPVGLQANWSEIEMHILAQDLAMRPTPVYSFQYDLKIEGDVLDLTISNVADSPEARGRECNMELALLHAYDWHTSEPVRRATDGTLIFRHWRDRSTHETYHLARRVLEVFAVEWVDGRHGRDRAARKATHAFVGSGAKCEYDWPDGDEPSDACGRPREEH